MIYRKLGASGIEVSAVGFGAYPLGGWGWPGTEQAKAVAAMHAAMDEGVNLVDTAPTYGTGRSEEIVGRAIRGRRDQVVLATKCGLIYDRREGSELFYHYDADGVTARPTETIYKCLRPESIRDELEQSLKRLGTTYVDLYQTHFQTSSTPIADTMATLLKLKEQGKIRAIGVSNVNLEQLTAYGPVDSDQEKYSMLDREIEQGDILPYCRRRGIAMLAYSPLCCGLLSGKIRPDQQFVAGDIRKGNPRFSPQNIARVNGMLERLRPVAERRGATTAQLVIAWTCSRPGMTSVLCGARDPQRAIENAAGGGIVLSADELETVNEIVGVDGKNPNC